MPFKCSLCLYDIDKSAPQVSVALIRSSTLVRCSVGLCAAFRCSIGKCRCKVLRRPTCYLLIRCSEGLGATQDSQNFAALIKVLQYNKRLYSRSLIGSSVGPRDTDQMLRWFMCRRSVHQFTPSQSIDPKIYRLIGCCNDHVLHNSNTL